MAEPQAETYPFHSKEWFDAVPTAEQKGFYKGPASNWITGSWPDITGDPDYEAARRFGHTTHPGWIRYLFAWTFDGGWQGSGTIEDPATLQQKKKDAVLPPRFLAGSEPSRTDNQRVMSFWVSSELHDPGLRIIDTTGTDPRCDIQLGLYIACRMYMKRKRWSENDFKGHPITQKELGLEGFITTGESEEDKYMIIKFLDSVKDGIPEIKIRGRRHERTSTPGREVRVAYTAGDALESVFGLHNFK